MSSNGVVKQNISFNIFDFKKRVSQIEGFLTQIKVLNLQSLNTQSGTHYHRPFCKYFKLLNSTKMNIAI